MDISTEAFGPSSNVTDDFSYTLINHGAFGYIDDSGDLAYVKGAAGIDFALAFAEGGIRKEFDHQLAAWNVRTRQPLEGFPRVMEDWQFFMSPAIVDLNDDNLAEVVAGSGGYLLHAFNYLGDEPEGWPKLTGGWLVASPNVGDFDGDGFYDVASATRAGYVFVWRAPGSTEGVMEWNGFGHDARHTFNYETGFPGQEQPDGDADEGDVGDPSDEVGPGDEPADEAPDTGGEDTAGDDVVDGADSGRAPQVIDDGCCAVISGDGRSNGLLMGLVAAALVLARGVWGRRRR
jgi:hypothetical protein